MCKKLGRQVDMYVLFTHVCMCASGIICMHTCMYMYVCTYVTEVLYSNHYLSGFLLQESGASSWTNPCPWPFSRPGVLLCEGSSCF